MKMLPGAETGQTDLLLRGERIGSRWHGSLGMNNFGYRPTGRVQLSGPLGIDNLLGINDVLDLHLNTTDRSRNSLSRGLSYRFPLGKNLLSLSYTYYRYRQGVPATLQEYLSEGTSRDLELKVERELFHTLTQKRGSLGGDCPTDQHQLSGRRSAGELRQPPDGSAAGIHPILHGGTKRRFRGAGAAAGAASLRHAGAARHRGRLLQAAAGSGLDPAFRPALRRLLPGLEPLCPRPGRSGSSRLGDDQRRRSLQRPWFSGVGTAFGQHRRLFAQ